MSILVVGGDFLGNIPKRLEESGFDCIQHCKGRKKLDIFQQVGENIDLVLVLTDFVGTDLSRKIKKEAKKHGVNVAFSRRAWSCIHDTLKKQGLFKPCSLCSHPSKVNH